MHMGGNPLKALIVDRTIAAVIDSIFPHIAEKDRIEQEKFYKERNIPTFEEYERKKAEKRALEEKAEAEQKAAEEYEEVIKVLPAEADSITDGATLPSLLRPSLKIRMAMKATKLMSFVHKRLQKILVANGKPGVIPLERLVFKIKETRMAPDIVLAAAKSEVWDANADGDAERGPMLIHYYLQN